MSSRYGSLVLAVGSGGVSALPESVVTSLPLAGFAASGPVVTSLAGFEGAAGLRLPQPPGWRTGIPAAFKYPACGLPANAGSLLQFDGAPSQVGRAR